MQISTDDEMALYESYFRVSTFIQNSVLKSKTHVMMHITDDVFIIHTHAHTHMHTHAQ